MTAPPGIHLHTTDLMFIIHLHFSTSVCTPRGECIATEEHIDIQGPILACGTWSVPAFCHWLVPPYQPVHSPSKYAPACLQPDPSDWPLQCAQLRGECTAMGEHTNNQSLCSCWWACHWPQLLLPSLAPITMCMSASRSFRWPPKWLCAHLKTPTALAAKGLQTTSPNCTNAVELKWYLRIPNQCCHMPPHLALCTTSLTVILHSNVPPPTG